MLLLLSKILYDLKFEKKMQGMEAYLQIDLNRELDKLWKDDLYVDYDWYLAKDLPDNRFLFIILNRKYVKKISIPKRFIKPGTPLWYIKIKYQDGIKETIYAENKENLSNIRSWFDTSSSS